MGHLSAGTAGAWLSLLLSLPSWLYAGAATVDEYQMKALYLFNFAQFVEWPAAAFAGAGEPIGICVMGDNPFGSSLHKAVAGKHAAGRSFRIREIKAVQQSSGCHLLFVPASEQENQAAILKFARDRNLLTVGETTDFLQSGGIIELRLKAGRLRFAIALEAASSSRLKISSKLLSLADNLTSARHE
jgi:hypothetical protein